MNFVAIDFETADQKRDSACAIGLVRVENGSIVYSDSALIRPPRPWMSPINQSVHGLSYDDVKNAPSFAEVWNKLAPILNGITTLVAHNVSFDRSVLRACCCLAKIEEPKVEWACTLEMSKKKWPKPASHKLNDVCSYLGIEFKNHHHAEADAEAAAKVYLALIGCVPASAPSGECAAILDEIPVEFRTEAVLNLMRDAEQLGPMHAADLVRQLGRWFHRERPGEPCCRQCSQRCSLMCDLCTECAAPGHVADAAANSDLTLLRQALAASNRGTKYRIEIDIGVTGRILLTRRGRQKVRKAFTNCRAALQWLTTQ